MKSKSPTKFMVCTALAATLGVLCIIGRFLLANESNNIKKGHAQIVQVGSKMMSKSEYLDYANGIMSKCTVTGIILLVVAVICFILYSVKNKKAQQSQETTPSDK